MNHAAPPPFQAEPNGSNSTSTIDHASAEVLAQVAQKHRLVIVALLINVAVNVSRSLFETPESPLKYFGIGMSVAVGLLAMFVVYQLAKLIIPHSHAVIFALAILIPIPLVSILGLFLINQWAVSFLTSHGVKVGFLGANPNSIRAHG